MTAQRLIGELENLHQGKFGVQRYATWLADETQYQRRENKRSSSAENSQKKQNEATTKRKNPPMASCRVLRTMMKFHNTFKLLSRQDRTCCTC
jgi:hypothetical protein